MCLHACARSLSPPHQHSHMVSANQTMSPPPRPAPQPHSVLPTGKPGCRERHTRSKGSEAGSAVVWGHSFWKKTAICPSEGFRAPSWWRQPSWSGESPGSSFWGGSPICCTRAPSASWHRGLAGEACGPEVGERAQDPEQSKPAGLGSRPERDSTFQTRQNDSPLEQ